MTSGCEGLILSYISEAIDGPVRLRVIANRLEMASAVTGLALIKSNAL